MKKIIFLFLLIISTFSTSYSTLWNWVGSIEGDGEERGVSIIVDKELNFYLAGYTNSQVLNFNNGISLINDDHYDGFVAKYNKDGLCQWASFNRGAYYAGAKVNLALDSFGNLYTYSQSPRSKYLKFNNNIFVDRTNTSHSNILAKYDKNGLCQWVENIHYRNDSYNSPIMIDNNNDVIITGDLYQGITDFNNNKSIDVKLRKGYFIAKYDSDGKCKSVHSIEGDNLLPIFSTAIDKDNNLIICGSFDQTLKVNDTLELECFGNWGVDAFLIKFDSTMNCKFAYKFGTNTEGITISSGDRVFKSLKIDLNGDIYITGYFNSKIMYLNNGDSLINSGLYNQIILVKMNSEGITQWAKEFGGTNNEYASYITISENNIYLSANSNSVSIKFNDNKIVYGFGGYDGLICNFDKNGNLNWVYQILGDGNDELCENYIFGNNELIMAGVNRSKPLIFENKFNLSKKGFSDIYIAKLNRFPTSSVASSFKFDLNIYPNPAEDFITIQLSNKGLQPFAGENKVQVFDMLGIEIMSVGIGLDLFTQRIDVSLLTPGMYFIRIGDKVEKFVKM